MLQRLRTSHKNHGKRIENYDGDDTALTRAEPQQEKGSESQRWNGTENIYQRDEQVAEQLIAYNEKKAQEGQHRSGKYANQVPQQGCQNMGHEAV